MKCRLETLKYICWLNDCFRVYVVSTIFQPCNGGDYLIIIGYEILNFPSWAYSSTKSRETVFSVPGGCYPRHGAQFNVPCLLVSTASYKGAYYYATISIRYRILFEEMRIRCQQSPKKGMAYMEFSKVEWVFATILVYSSSKCIQ